MSKRISIHRASGRTTAAMILTGLISLSVDAANLYRYRNADGVVVIEHAIPPEYVDQGYDILTTSGRLVERVPAREVMEERGQTPEEIEARRLGEERERQRRAAQEKEDRWLLMSYSSVDEVRQAGMRKLEQLGRELEIVRTNKAETLKQLDREKERAADYQRSGRALSENLSNALEALYRESEDADSLLAQRQAEFDEMKRRIEHQVQRFRQLKGL